MYPVAFSCLVVSKLLVIDRMMDFSKLKGHSSSSKWIFLGRLLVGFVIVCNVTSFAVSVAASVKWSTVADYGSFSKNASAPLGKSLQDIINGMNVGAAHYGVEAVVLLLVVVAVFITGLASARRIRAALGSTANSQRQSLVSVQATAGSAARQSAPARKRSSSVTGQKLMRQIMATSAAIFLSFLIRAVYATMFLLAGLLSDIPADAEVRCVHNLNSFSYLLILLLYHPAAFFVIAFICQPVVLLVSLWGMTSGQMIAIIETA
jgi:hypothetical protein